MASLLTDAPARYTGVFDVREYGATGNGLTLDTDAINRAIAAAAASGGGTVVFPPGDYLSHSIRLQSRIELRIGHGATIIAANPPEAGQSGGYDAPEPGPPNHFQDFGHSRFRNSLIWGEELEGVVICGSGRIFGRGLSRGNGRMAVPVGMVAPQPAGHLPDVLEADGVMTGDPAFALETGPFGYPNAIDSLPAGVGNKAIALLRCRNVVVRDLTLLHCGHMALLLAACDNVIIDRLLVDTNRDGIDIDACANVRVSHCSVNSPWDDGICIKASLGCGQLRPAENITVSDCYVSGFEEGTLYTGTRSRIINHRGGPIGRIKIGTEGSGGYRNIAITNCIFEFCRGLAMEQVDGGIMEDIVVSNLVMRDVMNAPIFVRTASRLRTSAAGVVSSARRISIENVVAHNISSQSGLFIAGTAGHVIEDLRLAGITLNFQGHGTKLDAERDVQQMPAAYPEPMLFGTLSSWGLFARYIKGLEVRDLRLRLMNADQRPAIRMEDVAEADLAGVRLPRGAEARDWVFERCIEGRTSDCDGLRSAAILG